MLNLKYELGDICLSSDDAKVMIRCTNLRQEVESIMTNLKIKDQSEKLKKIELLEQENAILKERVHKLENGIKCFT